MNINELTPVEEHDGYFLKRDDLFKIDNICGGKARTCWHIAESAKVGLITAGSRASPQVNIVAAIASKLKLPCRVHVPSGAFSQELTNAKNYGAEIIQHKPGYNSVIVARAKKDAEEHSDWTYVPFGMECEEALYQTHKQVGNIPNEIKRIVVPVGSGMSLAGILWGIKEFGLNISVLGVRVGADPIKRLNEYAPSNWTKNVQLVDSQVDYHKRILNAKIGEVLLDPVYEAKCLPFVQKGDLLWIVGIRETIKN